MVHPSPVDPSTEAVYRLCEGTRYEPVRFLGRGGMGEVWVVRQGLLKREFALKILHPRFGMRPEVIDRLRLEAQATARVDHPAVVRAIDFWVNEGGHACFVMELLSGRTLAEELSTQQRLPVIEVIDFGIQALSALSSAHHIGVIHRDIKPENLFIHELLGQKRQLKLLDFGLAKIIEDFAERTPTPAAKPTRPGAAVGTPRFMSPEAARGEPVDSRSDLFSLGLCLYEAITGQGPFDQLSPGVVEKPSALVQGVPPELDAQILRAIERDPDHRFQTAIEFEVALRPLLPSWHKNALRR
jgi:serine/threonine-protein kinase